MHERSSDQRSFATARCKPIEQADGRPHLPSPRLLPRKSVARHLVTASVQCHVSDHAGEFAGTIASGSRGVDAPISASATEDALVDACAGRLMATNHRPGFRRQGRSGATGAGQAQRAAVTLPTVSGNRSASARYSSTVARSAARAAACMTLSRWSPSLTASAGWRSISSPSRLRVTDGGDPDAMRRGGHVPGRQCVPSCDPS